MSRPREARYFAARRCFRCSRQSCKHRIVNDRFDEVACDDHSRDLEQHADAVLGGEKRLHITSSARVWRGQPDFCQKGRRAPISCSRTTSQHSTATSPGPWKVIAYDARDAVYQARLQLRNSGRERERVTGLEPKLLAKPHRKD